MQDRSLTGLSGSGLGSSRSLLADFCYDLAGDVSIIRILTVGCVSRVCAFLLVSACLCVCVLMCQRDIGSHLRGASSRVWTGGWQVPSEYTRVLDGPESD